MAEQEGWKPIAEAARNGGLSPRTAYNWVKSGKLQAAKRNGVTLVDPNAVQALAASRVNATAPASAGNAKSVGNGTPLGRMVGTALTPELEGRLFEAFGTGESPMDLVIRLKVSSDVVAAAYKRYQELRETAAPPAARLADRLLLHGERLDNFEANLNFATCSGALKDQVSALVIRVEALETQLVQVATDLSTASRTLSRLTQIRCSCGSHVVNVGRCPACEQAWDLRPTT